MSKGKVTPWPELKNTDRVKPTLTALQYIQKETKKQTVNPLTLAQTLQHYTTPQTKLSNVNQRASHGREETQTAQRQTLKGE